MLALDVRLAINLIYNVNDPLEGCNFFYGVPHQLCGLKNETNKLD